MKTYEKPTFRMEKFEVEEILNPSDPCCPVYPVQPELSAEAAAIYTQYLSENTDATEKLIVLEFTWN